MVLSWPKLWAPKFEETSEIFSAERMSLNHKILLNSIGVSLEKTPLLVTGVVFQPIKNYLQN